MCRGRDEPAQRLESRGRSDDGVGVVDDGQLLGCERGNREGHCQPVIAARVGAPAGGRLDPAAGPAIKPSARSSALMPSARNPATSAAMRSFLDAQLARPRTVTSPCAASAAIAGSSSMSPGTSSGAMSSVPMRSPSTVTRPQGSPARVAVTSTWTRAPNAGAHRAVPFWVGFNPTSSTSIRDPGSAAAATRPERRRRECRHREVLSCRRWPPVTETVRPSTATWPPKAASAARCDRGSRPARRRWWSPPRAIRQAGPRSSPARWACPDGVQWRAAACRES